MILPTAKTRKCWIQNRVHFESLMLHINENYDMIEKMNNHSLVYQGFIKRISKNLLRSIVFIELLKKQGKLSTWNIFRNRVFEAVKVVAQEFHSTNDLRG